MLCVLKTHQTVNNVQQNYGVQYETSSRVTLTASCSGFPDRSLYIAVIAFSLLRSTESWAAVLSARIKL